MKLLSYSDHVSDELVLRLSPGERAEVRAPSDAQRFFAIAKSNRCAFCGRRLRQVFAESGDLRDGDEGDESNLVYECGGCGWWEYEYYCRNEGSSWQKDDETKRIYWGILRRYAISSTKAPLEDLRRTVLKKPDLLHEISWQRMEKLVQYCFSSYFSCEVEHCGRTGDGGMDLFLVQSDEPILVQVRRRMTDRKSEGIRAVRDLLGAMLIERAKSAIYVTTARRFSRHVKEAADKIVREETVRRFDLIDRNRFVGMLKLARPNRYSVNDLPWVPLLETLQSIRYPSINDWYKRSVDRFGVGRVGVRKERALLHARALRRAAPGYARARSDFFRYWSGKSRT